MSKKITRCKWAEGVSLDYIEYHDTEWGVPVYDDPVQFEFLLPVIGLANLLESRVILHVAVGDEERKHNYSGYWLVVK